MKYSWLFILIFPFYVNGQNSFKDNVINTFKIESELDTNYIKDYKQQLNVRLELSNDKDRYTFPYENEKVTITPNMKVRYAMALNYKFASLKLGFRSGTSDEEKEKKGDSDIFKINVTFLFNHWVQKFEYNRQKGFYITNSNDFIDEFKDSEIYLQFPKLTATFFSGSTGYKFNKNYSLRATVSQTEIQLKSAGSFIPSVDYWFYKIDGTRKFKNEFGEVIDRSNHNEYKGFNFILNAGYHYTYVYRKNWYANGFLIPGIGIDLYETTFYREEVTYDENFEDYVLSLQSGIALGYNNEKFYAGLIYNNRLTNEQYNKNDMVLQSSKNSFKIFIGYRFKPPRTISSPIDQIEEKVPILKQDNNL